MEEQKLKYKELLEESKEKIEAEELLSKVEDAELDVRNCINKTRKALNRAKRELKEELRSGSFNYKQYTEKEQEVEELKLGLANAEKFLKERFD